MLFRSVDDRQRAVGLGVALEGASSEPLHGAEGHGRAAQQGERRRERRIALILLGRGVGLVERTRALGIGGGSGGRHREVSDARYLSRARKSRSMSIAVAHWKRVQSVQLKSQIQAPTRVARGVGVRRLGEEA